MPRPQAREPPHLIDCVKVVDFGFDENLLIDYVKVVEFGFDVGFDFGFDFGFGFGFATVVTTRTCTLCGTSETDLGKGHWNLLA